MGLFGKKRRKTPLSPAREKPVRLLGYQTASLQGIGARERQEDAFVLVNENDAVMIKKRGLLAAVADGMGGMLGGTQASGSVTATLAEDMDRLDTSGNIADQLRRSVIRAGEAVYSSLGGDGGSTVVAALIFDEKLYFSSVGDSYLYLLRDGSLVRLNREHNLRAERRLAAIRSGRMPAAEDDDGPEAQALSSFLGMPGTPDVDGLLRPMGLRDGDVLLLCSDGVGGVLDQAALTGALSGPSASAACRAMDGAIARARRQFQDNYTALVIRCVY